SKDVGETEQVDTFIPKEQSSANISGTANASQLCSELVPLEQNSKSVPIQLEETKVSHNYIVAHPSRNQAQSIISSEINIMTEHQPCDPGSHPHVTETKNDSIQKDSRIEMQKFIQELYLEPVSEESIEVIKNKEPDISDHNENDKHIVECVPCDLESHPYVTKSSDSNDLAESELRAGSARNFRGIDNYSFASPQLWSSPCPVCDGKYENYGLYGEWYRNETEYCLTCNTSSNKLKFAINVTPGHGIT
ncbi:24045_t:CDS:2, partial [Dentiscutata erythropus]